MKKTFILLFATLIYSSFSFAQPSFIKDSLDSYITQGMKDWNIPGLAIAIVKDGQVVMMKGYGVRDLETKEPVDENTLFMIASNSKLFTGTALAQLDYNKKLSLDDKITKYFPDYRVYDSCTTQLVTIKDMLGHHLGTKTFQGDFTWWNSNLSRNEIMYKMRYLKPNQNFRASYGYCNSCFLTAGEIIPKVTGKPWEVYVYDSIVEPLQMTHTHTLGQGMSQMPDAATPYTNTFSQVLKPLPYDNVDNLAPAGSMVSCVNDLKNWLLMQLDSGRYNGKQILKWPVLQKTRDANTIISTRKNLFIPTHFSAYGLGVFIKDYNGKELYEHTGGADGFVTSVCFVPEEKLGITILTNNDNQSFFELLRYQILDAYLGVPYTNRSKVVLKIFNEERQKNLDSINALKARVNGNRPPLPLSAYTGNYENQLFGKIKITIDKDNLKITFPDHRNLAATLQYMDNGQWLMTYNHPAFGIFPLTFKTEGNKVVATDVKVNDFLEYDPYTFVKE
ncbi:serine hydrolase [Ilyomonas limi]|uniref:Serine hydrolase n=1 Tax=Ilyomonas limi TaxID=2575867 RepID=A0A4V5UTG2_9BACT|nr:serine hydrolase [Ilyomonas limi]TKK64913.1 serine hydrolase [Ilyomonas limi]